MRWNKIIPFVIILTLGSLTASYGQSSHKPQIFLSPYAGIGNTFHFYSQLHYGGDVSGVSFLDAMGSEISPAHLTGLQAEIRFRNRMGLSAGAEVNYMQFWGEASEQEIPLPFRQTWFHLALPLTASWYQPIGKQGYRLRLEGGVDFSIYTDTWSAFSTFRQNQAMTLSHAREQVFNQGLRWGTGLNLPLSGGSDMDISALLLWGLWKPVDTRLDFYQRDEAYTLDDFHRRRYQSDQRYWYTLRLRPVQVLVTLRYNFNLSQVLSLRVAKRKL